jgi:hypothetical protein
MQAAVNEGGKTELDLLRDSKPVKLSWPSRQVEQQRWEPTGVYVVAAQVDQPMSSSRNQVASMSELRPTTAVLAWWPTGECIGSGGESQSTLTPSWKHASASTDLSQGECPGLELTRRVWRRRCRQRTEPTGSGAGDKCWRLWSTGWAFFAVKAFDFAWRLPQLHEMTKMLFCTPWHCCKKQDSLTQRHTTANSAQRQSTLKQLDLTCK